jgi:hypothetical protein
MLVAWTVVAVWLGWNAQLVHSRKAFLASLKQPMLALVTSPVGTIYEMHDRNGQIRIETYISRDPKPNSTLDGPFEGALTQDLPSARGELSTLRKWLGDQLYHTIVYQDGPPLSQARKLFPEAVILVPPELGGADTVHVEAK